MEMWQSLCEILTCFLQQNITLFIVTIIFMALDIVSGIAGAIKTGTYSSTKLREGLAHKLGSLFVIFAVAIIQVAMFDPNFTVTFDVPLFNTVCCIIIFMEFSSIIENACILNPELNKYVGKFIGKDKDENDVNDYAHFGDYTVNGIDDEIPYLE